MLIHEISRRTGLSIPTIRYYEQVGLLGGRHVRRMSNNYRTYDEAVVPRLVHFKQARANGFTISELKEIAQAHDAGKLTVVQRRQILLAKLRDLDRKVALLRNKQKGITAELYRLDDET